MRDARGEVEYELDEELRVAPSKRVARSLVPFELLAVLAVLLTLTGVIQLDGEHRAAPPQATPTPTRTATASAPRILRSIPVIDENPAGTQHINVPSCPQSITCILDASLPAGVLAAVTEYLPGNVAFRKIAVTQTDPLRVYYRRLDVASGGVRLSVWLRQSDILDGLEATSRTSSSRGATDNFVLVITPDNYEVAVQAKGPATKTPSLAELRALAADVRLVALS
jgi:hypothetical protein